MTGDKEKLQSYSALEKERKVSFGNDTPALIKGKGSVVLKEKVNARNVMFVDGLKHNLLSVSKMCDEGNEVVFRSNGCIVRELETGERVMKGIRTPNNLYILKGGQQQCYLSINEEQWLWHKRLGHISFPQIRKTCKYQAIHDLPNIKIPENTICKSCQFGLLRHKDEAFKKFKTFKALVGNELDHKIKCLRSNRGGEFTEDEFLDFCEENGIRREFSTARTPQQNGVVERMKKMVQRMVHAMLDESRTPATF
eukprot:PITA_03264